MKMNRTEENGVITIKRNWGRLLIDKQDEYLLDGWAIAYKPWKNNPAIGAIELRKKSKRKRIYLARAILQCPKGMEVDHINHDPTDNRRINLRICTRTENLRNKRKQRRTPWQYKGVFYHSHGRYTGKKTGVIKRWRAYTRVQGKRIWLGYYATEREAAIAYNNYAIKTFGEFACLNDVGTSLREQKTCRI